MLAYSSTTLELIRILGALPTAEFLDLYERCLAEGKKSEAKRFAWARCATDLHLFAAHYFPHFCTDPFNGFHYAGFKEMAFGERNVRRARGAPRGYAKSTHRALIRVLHDICYKQERYIVLLSNTQEQTVQKLKDIRGEVLTNARLARDYDIRFTRGVVNASEFVVHVGSRFTCKVQGFSAGSQIRGVKFGPFRPTKFVADDVEHSEEVFNEALRVKYMQWFQEDVVKAGHKGVNIEFVGTVLHRDSLLKNLLRNPLYDGALYQAIMKWPLNQKLWSDWERILTNLEDFDRVANSDAFYYANKEAMDEGAEVLWPEREPLLLLMKEKVEIGERAFMKEKQNEPLGADDKVFKRFRWYREETQDGKLGARIEETNNFVAYEDMRAYGAMDPSTGQQKAHKGKKGDYTCILSGYERTRGKDHQLFVAEDWTRRESPSEYIKEIFTHQDRFKYEKFGVESNLYRNLLLPNIRAEAKRQDARIPLYDIEATEKKEKRIYTLEPKLTHGYIVLNRTLSPEFKAQLDDFPHADHDDCPDTLEMLWGMIDKPYRARAVDLNAVAGR